MTGENTVHMMPKIYRTLQLCDMPVLRSLPGALEQRGDTALAGQG